MLRINTINFIAFLLVQLSFMSLTNAIYETVNIKIKNGDEIIDLSLKRTGQHVANKNLPIWYIEKRRDPRILRHIMSEIGDFTTYHDVEKSAAVVYFRKFQFFYGVIDTRFYIAQLPISVVKSNMYLEVGGGYVIARNTNGNGEYFHDGQSDAPLHFFTDAELQFINSLIDTVDAPNLQPEYHNQHEFNMPSTYNQAGPSVSDNSLRRHPKSKILYPEVLVFVTHDVYAKFLQTDAMRGLYSLVMYYIVYFNAIDMLFAKLATGDIAIHINIAGLVIEAEPRVFPYMIDRTFQRDGRISYHLRTTLFSFRFPQYLKKYRHTFVEDSFDFCFISTNYEVKKSDDTPYGLSSSEIDVYRQRYLKQTHDNILGLIVKSHNDFSDYVSATRGIARLMGVKHDLPSANSHNNDKQCYAIMQESRSHCRNCLAWSAKSRDEFRAYVRSNRNHCFLLNYPRSLYPYGQRIFSMYPEDQCMCYQFPADTLDPFHMVSIPHDYCDQPLRCSFDQTKATPTPIPLDGTPCYGLNRVCWRKECVDIIR